MNYKELKKLQSKKEFLGPIFHEFKNHYMKFELINIKILEKTMDEIIEKNNFKRRESEQAKKLFDVWLDSVLTIGLNKTNELFEDIIFKK